MYGEFRDAAAQYHNADGGRLKIDLAIHAEYTSTPRIVEEMGCSIPELFRRIGEMGFRDTETAMIRDIAARQGKVIATGGGAVLRPENVALLKENGRVYFLDRSLSLLTATSDRPLSSTTEALRARYEERYPIYCGVCDVHMAADGTIDHVVNKIREDFLYEHFGD